MVMWMFTVLILGTLVWGFWLVMLLGVPAYVVYDQVILPLFL